MIAVRWIVLAVAAASVLLALDRLADPRVVALAVVDPVATTVAALALLAGAAAIMLTETGGAAGILLASAAVAWTAPIVEGHQGLPDPLRSAAAVAGALLVPVLAATAIRLGAGPPPGRAARRMSQWVLGTAFVLVGAIMLIRDPLVDPDCWANCNAGSFVLVSLPAAARVLELVFAGYLVVASLIAAWVVGAGVRRSAGTGRLDARLAASVAAALATVSATVLALVMAAAPPYGGAALVHRLPVLITATLLVLLGAAVATAAVGERRRATALARFADDLRRTPQPGGLETGLREVLHDPGLRVLFPAGPDGRFVDAAGRATPPPAEPSSTTELRRDGAAIAVLEHAAPVSSAGDLELRIGPAARLAVDNERMRALVLAELEELRASRARIVETGDAARRAIERDLHDRAQQSLLAALFELGLVRARAAEQGDAPLERRAAELLARVDGLIADLRRLAHGVFPAVLDDAGLEAALEDLAESSTVPLEIRWGLAGRLPAPVERAAYAVVRRVTECVDGSDRAVEVALGRVGDDARLAIRPVVRCDLAGVRDRVGAIGGSMLVSEDRIEVVIPCG
ncbi:sensor histidine kinase [Agromyces aurantiacus]|uniref:Sensor histidine kinase n=1 Tax=Agromyces aurantiacus TaxID=165814 RepID=A0ABV9R2G5_9MICO|nr:histidine kinase [Agromyces aurantiacus]MBM7505933.1 signal transduction histidine kinase [Agromyces aurantiacus]